MLNLFTKKLLLEEDDDLPEELDLCIFDFAVNDPTCLTYTTTSKKPF